MAGMWERVRRAGLPPQLDGYGRVDIHALVAALKAYISDTWTRGDGWTYLNQSLAESEYPTISSDVQDPEFQDLMAFYDRIDSFTGPTARSDKLDYVVSKVEPAMIGANNEYFDEAEWRSDLNISAPPGPGAAVLSRAASWDISRRNHS